MKKYSWDDISPTVGTAGPYYLASEVDAKFAEYDQDNVGLSEAVVKLGARITALEKALAEAMEWNWCDDDMNEGVRNECERVLRGQLMERRV